MNTYTVTQVNKYIKKILDNDFILSNIMIKGEISNFKNHSSGDFYFSFKDFTKRENTLPSFISISFLIVRTHIHMHIITSLFRLCKGFCRIVTKMS